MYRSHEENHYVFIKKSLHELGLHQALSFAGIFCHEIQILNITRSGRESPSDVGKGCSTTNGKPPVASDNGSVGAERQAENKYQALCAPG